MKKDKLIKFRSSEEDIELLERASNKLSDTTGKKPNVSKAIRESVKQFAINEPEMFFCNRQAIVDVDTNIEFCSKSLQAIYDELKAVTGEEATIDEITSFYGPFVICNKEKITDFVYNKILRAKQKQCQQLGIIVTRSMIVMPDLEKLFEVSERLVYGPMVSYRDVFYMNCFSFKNDKVIVKNDQVEQIKNQFRCYAVTTDEMERLNATRKLCRSLDSLNHPEPEKLNVPNVAYWDQITGRFEPSETFVKFGKS